MPTPDGRTVYVLAAHETDGSRLALTRPDATTLAVEAERRSISQPVEPRQLFLLPAAQR